MTNLSLFDEPFYFSQLCVLGLSVMWQAMYPLYDLYDLYDLLLNLETLNPKIIGYMRWI